MVLLAGALLVRRPCVAVIHFASPSAFSRAVEQPRVRKLASVVCEDGPEEPFKTVLAQDGLSSKGKCDLEACGGGAETSANRPIILGPITVPISQAPSRMRSARSRKAA